ncbi:DUF2061 domain-containing protein [Pikeienuella piscinae]|uniref:DUF2061 domain-containing protein n=1 Tax=Pikeienuella piscinae TaxID=2748098 RepID=A0A7M3T5S3_9RHOB|nr:DUF2061 domain-containing protein [Pikeienuella piscinae]QIE57354.1 DUF2061 domain-containing protein [Pikeienuella piscinae]
MDSTQRTLAKTCTWQISGLIVMTLVTYAVTGSLIEGGTVALIGTVLGAFSYAIHERLWAQVRWGRLNRP